MLCNLLPFLNGQAILAHQIIHTQSHNQSNIIANRFAHCLQNLNHKPCTIICRTAIFISAVIGIRRKERTQELACTSMKLQRIKSHFRQHSRTGSNLFYILFDFLHTHSANRFSGIGIQNIRRAQALRSISHTLGHHFTPIDFYLFHSLAHSQRTLPIINRGTEVIPFRTRRTALNSWKTNQTWRIFLFCTINQAVNFRLCEKSIVMRQMKRHGRIDNPVFQFHIAYLPCLHKMLNHKI